jgi:hypothetical protein
MPTYQLWGLGGGGTEKKKERPDLAISSYGWSPFQPHHKIEGKKKGKKIKIKHRCTYQNSISSLESYPKYNLQAIKMLAVWSHSNIPHQITKQENSTPHSP